MEDNTVIFDFENISNIDEFYAVAKSKLSLPEHFGNNLDALWDSVTGDIALPLKINFINLTMNKLETFDGVIKVFEDAEDELGDDFSFSYSLSI